MEAEGLERIQHRRVVIARRLGRAGDPGVYIGVGRIEQALERVQLIGRQAVQPRLRKPPHNQIRLLESPPPGAEGQPLLAVNGINGTVRIGERIIAHGWAI